MYTDENKEVMSSSAFSSQTSANALCVCAPSVCICALPEMQNTV